MKYKYTEKKVRIHREKKKFTEKITNLWRKVQIYGEKYKFTEKSTNIQLKGTNLWRKWLLYGFTNVL